MPDCHSVIAPFPIAVALRGMRGRDASTLGRIRPFPCLSIFLRLSMLKVAQDLNLEDLLVITSSEP